MFCLWLSTGLGGRPKSTLKLSYGSYHNYYDTMNSFWWPKKHLNFECTENFTEKNPTDPLHDFEGTILGPFLGRMMQNFAALVDIVMLL